MTRDERLAERETVIRWDGHKNEVRIYTASPVIDRKIRRAGHEPYQESTRKGVWSGSFYTIPYKSLRWGVRVPRVKKSGPSDGESRGKRGRFGRAGVTDDGSK